MVSILFVLFTYLNKLKHWTFMTLVIKLRCVPRPALLRDLAVVPKISAGVYLWYELNPTSVRRVAGVLFFFSTGTIDL